MTPTPNKVEAPELLAGPCPCCGSPATIEFGGEVGRWDTYDIECNHCGLRINGPTGAEGDAAKALAVAAWNRRAPSSEVLPCDVRVPPATVIKAGCTFDTLRLAMSVEGRPRHFKPRTPDERIAGLVSALKKAQEKLGKRGVLDTRVHEARPIIDEALATWETDRE